MNKVLWQYSWTLLCKKQRSLQHSLNRFAWNIHWILVKWFKTSVPFYLFFYWQSILDDLCHVPPISILLHLQCKRLSLFQVAQCIYIFYTLQNYTMMHGPYTPSKSTVNDKALSFVWLTVQHSNSYNWMNVEMLSSLAVSQNWLWQAIQSVWII